jgi:hypothetical protein
MFLPPTYSKFARTLKAHQPAGKTDLVGKSEDAESIETEISANSGSDLSLGQGENDYDWEFPSSTST